MMKRDLLDRIGSAALDAVFPPRCAVCGAWGPFICSGCEAQLEPTREPRCSRCWRPIGAAGSPCPNHHADALDGIRAGFVYQGVARDLVHGLKYRRLTALAGPMALLLADCAWSRNIEVDAIVPVPLAPARKRTRGHNQAEALSSQLAKVLDIAHVPRAIERRRNAPPQARSANVDERHHNVAGAFFVRLPGLIEGRRIAVVDDVTTTGATLASCASALRSARAAYVIGLAFARED